MAEEKKLLLLYEAINKFKFEWFGSQGKREIEIWSSADPQTDPAVIRANVESKLYAVLDGLKEAKINFLQMPTAELAKMVILEDDSFTQVMVMEGNKGFSIYKRD